MIINVSKNPLQEHYYTTIDKALKNCNDQDIIHLYPGVYEETFNINKELKIIGIGDKNDIKIVDSNSKYQNTIFILEKVTIENITIESLFGNAIHIYAAMDVSIKYCNIISLKGRAISINGSSDFLFTHCNIKSPDLSILYDNYFNTGGTFNHCKIETDQGYCIRVIKNSVITLLDCNIINHSNHCFCICDESIIKIKNCNFDKICTKDIVVFMNNALKTNFIYL